MSLAQDIPKKIQKTAYAISDYFQASENTILIIISIVIGILGGLGAVGFRLLIQSIQTVTTGPLSTPLLENLSHLPWYYILILPALGGVIVGPLVHFFAREAKGHGVPEVMEAVALHGGRIRPRLVFVKSLASAITIATGGSVGREGPIVQVGSAVGSSIGILLRMPLDRLRVCVGCGAAAGIAATFNAPVAGVIFAIELILGNYAITTLTPLIVSSVSATVICYAFPAVTGGNIRAFSIPFNYELVSAWEIPIYGLFGVCAGLVALAFVVLIYAFEDIFDRINIPPYTKPVVGGLLLGALYLLIQYVIGDIHCFGVGYESIEMSMREELVWYLLLALIGFKLIATPLTVGCGLSGGVFAPSLFIGAMTGGAFGIAVNALYPEISGPSGAYALVGMAAIVAGTTHAPIMAILMLFELTGDYQIILPLMISCVISSLLTSRLKKDSIYTQKLSRRGINLSQGVESTIMESTSVKNIMRESFPTVYEDASFSEIVRLLMEDQYVQLYVVDKKGILKGIITLNDVKTILAEDGLAQLLVAADVMDTMFPLIGPTSSMADCMTKFGTFRFEELPLLEPYRDNEGELVGVVTRRDIFLLYNQEVLRRGALGLKYICRKPENEERQDYVEMPPDHQVDHIRVNSKLTGQTLKDLDIRNRYNLNVVAIRRKNFMYEESEDSNVPDPNQVLRRTDTLIVTGTRNNVEQFKKIFGVKDSN